MEQHIASLPVDLQKILAYYTAPTATYEAIIHKGFPGTPGKICYTMKINGKVTFELPIHFRILSKIFLSNSHTFIDALQKPQPGTKAIVTLKHLSIRLGDFIFDYDAGYIYYTGTGEHPYIYLDYTLYKDAFIAMISDLERRTAHNYLRRPRRF